MKDNVNHPSHYCGSIEVIDFIEAYDLGFHLGNVVKYISRAGHKEDTSMSIEEKALEDLKKAKFYLDREIQRREKNATDKYHAGS